MKLTERRGLIPRITAVAAAAGMMAALAIPAGSTLAAAATATTIAAPHVPVLKWTSCDSGFQCATARVPMDYRHPDGAEISIAVVRHLATDPAQRIGSLFINGGGPSEQIEGFLAEFQVIPAALREHYDLISFDPRGFGYSTAVRCFPTAAAEQQFLSALPPFPVGAKQIAAWDRTYAAFDALCAQRNGSLLDHDTTADVARDMNLLREAVGDPVLNYVGLSYGSALGATYANLFPGTVGRMVLDGNVNPVTWTTQGGSLPVFLRLGADEGSAANMAAFLTLCGKAAKAACAFSAGTPAATTAKWNTLLSRLSKRPVTIGSPPQIYTYAAAITAVPLSQVSQWTNGASLLQQLWVASAKTAPAANASAQLAARTAPAARTVYTGLEQSLAELCADSQNPRNPATYAADDKLAYARAGGFGLEWLWTSEPCAQWPGNGAQDRYTGPWNRPTANTILLIGNTHDAALPYQDSLAMSRDLARARLLTVRGYGHTEQQNPSTCATGYELGYLLTNALPATGTTCKEDTTPFSS
jgi:pimeloyl-ACP methyl ester carboxylesterase